ncbi:ATP-dependent nuclease [Pseudomonas syringae]|uniref:ATP-dependent nuclease n=1 Tax=Pseudomonas syringae TaxID=317 RepID=UPI0004222EF3|nr:AAA family ATPase [Pseudomonas syringae]MBS7419298.1 AAA family ATPase [Pseudomonas syringae]NAO52173.1 AAA family ATPase [Pseudomonas syringae]UOF18881.1 AAA family ATPase [Pseudomonas syringae CC440]UZA81261.1 AAA family ATPase [Pseudomonas syringae]
MPTKYKFLLLKYKSKPSLKNCPTFVLYKDSWDDYTHKVKFHLEYFDEDGNRDYIGAVKILERTAKTGTTIQVLKNTTLEESFMRLGPSYISLGQGDDYYTNIYDLFPNDAKEILLLLNDVAIDPELGISFEASPAFRNALARENGAQRSRRFGFALASGEKINERSAFSYAGAIVGASEEVEAHFDFDDNDPIPGRIVAIIGRNAVGKTQFLAKLGEDLAQLSRTSNKSIKRRDFRFSGDRPLYTRVIAISYSAFDKFKRPAPDSTFSYVYCGIRNDKGSLSLVSLDRTYRENIRRVRKRGLEEAWVDHMRCIFGDSSNDLIEQLLSELDADELEKNSLTLLSSGQSVLTHLVTALLAWIQPNTMVLFDEPETHLHPNAVASLLVVLSNILKDYDSYAIVATHSPVVIQEVPAKRVLVFQRDENTTTAQTLEMESFGESVTELTKQVFETIDVESVYRGALKKLARIESIEEALSRFDLGLSISAEAYLLAQYTKKESKK